MKSLKIIILSVLVIACGEEKKKQSVYIYEEWVPVIVKEGDTEKYWDFGIGSIDTLHKGEIFKAKLYMPIHEFYDSLGQNIILSEQKMDFEIGEDTARNRRIMADYFSLNKFIKVAGDTGFIAIPVDSILNRFNINSVSWRASIMPTKDTTFRISGRWYFK